MKKNILISLLSSSLLFAQVSNAGEWGVGGLIGASNADGIGGTEASFGANVSYDFNKVWGVELGYVDLGDFDSNVGIPVGGFFGSVPGNVSVDLSALYLAGTATTYLGSNWSLTGRAGVTEVDIDVSVSTDFFGDEFSSSADDSTTELFLGASLNYNFNKNLQAQLRYDYFSEAESFAFGLKYSFGK